MVPKKKNKGGRPTVMTESVVTKLEEMFAIGATDEEACFYAGIPKKTLYEYCKRTPGFRDRKEGLKDRPVLKARRTVVEDLEKPESAKWYLERKRKNEFSQKQEIDQNINLEKTVIYKPERHGLETSSETGSSITKT
jgi:hypothetical protein